MKYQVIKSFVDVGDIMRKVGDIIDLDGYRAGKLLQYRLIGLVKETAVKKVEVEKAVVDTKVDAKEIKHKPKNKKRKPI